MDCIVALLFLTCLVLVVVVIANRSAVNRAARSQEEVLREVRQLRAEVTHLSRLAPGSAPPGNARGDSAAADATLAAAGPTVVIPRAADYEAAEAELSGSATMQPEDVSSDAASGGAPPASAAHSDAPAPRAAGGGPREPSTALGDRRPDARTIEDFLGTRVLLVVGVVVVLFALGFFLKYAIDRGLIPPSLRVAIGVLSGIGALIGGGVLRRRGFDLFGHGVMGGGLGALFISTFFAAARYDLISRPLAFGVTALVAAIGVGIAVRREAPLLAYLGFLGGYLAPAILGENVDALAGLTGWLIVLHAGVGATLWFRRWPGLDLLSLAACVVYWIGWADRYLAPERMGAGAAALCALTAATLAVALLPPLIRGRTPIPTALATAILTGVVAVTAGFEFFYDDHRIALGVTILAVALLYIVSARRVESADGTVSERDTAISALRGCAVAAVAAAVPVLFEGNAIPPVWSVAGAVTVFLGARRTSVVTALGGLVMIVLAQVHLIAELLPMHDGAFLLPFANVQFLVFVSPSAALAVSGLILRRGSPWRTPSGLCLGAAAWLYAPVLVMEVIHYFSENRVRFGVNTELLGLSAALGALAAYTILLAWLVRERALAAMTIPIGTLLVAGLMLIPVCGLIDRPEYVPVLNPAFFAGLVVVAAAWATTAAARAPVRGVLLIVAVAYGLALIGLECSAYAENATASGLSDFERARRALAAASVAMALYGAVLLALGFRLRTAALRWSGLVIFLMTIVKVFFVDLANLPTVHRIAGFFVLGMMLLGGSFFYQRVRRAPDEPDEGA